MSLNFKLIGRRVKETRTWKRMSQAELAEHINRSVPYISHIETATKHPSLITLVLIANALDVTVDTLLNGNQKRDSSEYHLELIRLISDCDSDERRFIYRMASAAKDYLRDDGRK